MLSQVAKLNAECIFIHFGKEHSKSNFAPFQNLKAQMMYHRSVLLSAGVHPAAMGTNSTKFHIKMHLIDKIS